MKSGKLLATLLSVVFFLVIECQDCPPYDPVPFMCCNGTVNYKPNETPRTCCGSKAFSTSSHMCCAAHINPRPQGEGTPGCCGPMVIIHEQHICCRITVNPRLSDDTGCCGSRSFDRYTQMCCEENIVTKPINGRCCGPNAYNELTHKCCPDKKIIEKGYPCPPSVVELPHDPEYIDLQPVEPGKKVPMPVKLQHVEPLQAKKPVPLNEEEDVYLVPNKKVPKKRKPNH